MHDECLGLEIDAPRGGSAGIGGGGHINWAGGIVAAKRKVADQAAVEIEVGSKSGVPTDGSLSVGWKSATAMSARAKGGGKVFPRFFARRRIPRQARELK
jgi:hypothetical protein